MSVTRREPGSDAIAMAAQADLDRLFALVIRPALKLVAEPPAVDPSAFVLAPEPSPEWPAEGWDQPGALTPTYPAGGWMLDSVREALLGECHRGFAVMLGATFERQLRAWLVSLRSERAATIEGARRPTLWAIINEASGVAIEQLPVAGALEELWELVSALRHGSGRAMRHLARLAPHMWPKAGPSLDNRLPDPEVTGDDLRRYHRATAIFWGEVGATPPGGAV